MHGHKKGTLIDPKSYKNCVLVKIPKHGGSSLCVYCLQGLSLHKHTTTWNVDDDALRCNYLVDFAGSRLSDFRRMAAFCSFSAYLFIMPHNTSHFRRSLLGAFWLRLTVASPWFHVPVCRLNDKSFFFPAPYRHGMVVHGHCVDCVCWV